MMSPLRSIRSLTPTIAAGSRSEGGVTSQPSGSTARSPRASGIICSKPLVVISPTRSPVREASTLVTTVVPSPKRATLADYINVPDVYAAGRLDRDSEGLLLLTDDGRLQHKIADPKHKTSKTYWVQVEGVPTAEQLQRLREGVELNDGMTLPAEARQLDEPELWPRNPPVRFRKSVPTSWLELVIREGRNRQVRRMTAAVGLPTLRLVRVRIGPWSIEGLAPGEWRAVPAQLP